MLKLVQQKSTAPMYSTTKSHFTNRTPFVKLSGILLAFIVFYGCTPKKYVDKSHDQEYKKDNKALEVDYLIYHYDDLQSRIYYVIDNKNVIYKKTDSSQAFTASLKLRYKIIPDPDSRIILDSGSFTITDKQVLLKQGSIGGYVSFNCKAGLAAYIELQLKDENRKTENLVQLPIDKQNTFSTQNFLLLQADSAVAVNSHFRSGTNLIVQHNRRAGQKIIVEWYRYNLKLPPPPFSELSYSAPEYRPDSIFEVYPVKNGYPVSLKQTGVYTFKAEPSSAAGCTVFVSDNDFPKVVTHEQMIACTRYILNKEEYKKLMEAADKQKAIEQYWLETGGNSDRARELIRKYY